MKKRKGRGDSDDEMARSIHAMYLRQSPSFSDFQRVPTSLRSKEISSLKLSGFLLIRDRDAISSGFLLEADDDDDDDGEATADSFTLSLPATAFTLILELTLTFTTEPDSYSLDAAASALDDADRAASDSVPAFDAAINRQSDTHSLSRSDEWRDSEWSRSTDWWWWS